MAVNRELAVIVKVINDQLVSGLRQSETAIKNFAAQSSAALDQVEERSENIQHVWKGMLEAFIGVEIVDTLKRIADAADEATERLQVAATTAKNFGNSLDPNAMEAWLQAFARSKQGGGFQLPDMRDAVARFSAIGLDDGQIKRALADSANLAAALKISFPEAVNIAREALTGHVEMLTRYGVISREAAKNIHTVEQAMEALENATKGAAEKRADDLAGSFGRLTNSIMNLGTAFGQYLIPYFDAVANGLTKIADAVLKLPKWLLEAAAGVAFITLSLTALGLILPAIKLGAEFVANAFGLMRTMAGLLTGGLEITTAAAAEQTEVFAALRGGFITTEEAEGLLQASTVRTQGAFGLLRTFIIGPVMSAFQGFVSLLRGVITALAVDLVGADAAVAAGFAEVLAPIIAVVAAIAGLTAAVLLLTHHWQDAMNFLSRAFDEFYRNVWTKADNLKRLLSDLAATIANPAAGVANLSVDLATMMPNTSKTITGALKDGTDYLVGKIKEAWKDVVGFFSGAAGNIKIPHERFEGVIPGGKKGSDTAAKAAEDAFKNFDEAIKTWLATFADAVDHAKAKADTAAANLDAFRAKFTRNDTPENSHQAHEIAALITTELHAQEEVRQRLAAQAAAEAHAQQQFLEAAKAVSPHLKNHDELVRQALDAAREHGKTAENLRVQYAQMAKTIADLVRAIRNDLNQGIEADVATSIEKIQAQLRSAQAGIEAQKVSLTNAEDVHRETGHERPEERAGYQLQMDRLDIALAELAVSAAKDTLALKQHADALERTKESHAAVDQAQRDLTTTTDQLRAAQARLSTDTATYTKALEDRFATFSKALDGLVSKMSVPGLQQRQGGGFTFSPWEFLLDAFSKTRSFADIMATVNQIMHVFVQIMDALRPVIDTLLVAVRTVVNVFITLYNTVGKILSLFGIHIAQIQELNAAYANYLPLIEVTHDIPTLNELAAGKLQAPLSLIPVGLDNVHQSIQSGFATGNSLLGEILGVLFAIRIAIMVAGMFGGGGSGGGILGFFSHLLGLGGGAASPGADMGTLTTGVSDGLSGAYDAIQTVPDMSSAVSSGVQDALVQDGGSTSGGLFTSFTNALHGAMPDLLAAAGGYIVGNLIGHGRPDAGIGGAIGGTAGMMLGGPIGAAVGSVLGGLIGGLFGPNPANEPDIYHTQQWGQENADLWGATMAHPMNANGSQFIEDPQLAQQTGGMGLLQWLGQYIAQGGKGLTAAQIAEFQGEDTASPITGGKNGMLDLANGMVKNYNDLFNDAMAAFKTALQNGANAAQGFTAMLHGATDVHAWMTNQLTQPGSSGSSGTSVGGTTQATAAPNLTLSVHIDKPTLHGVSDVDKLGERIGTGVLRAWRTRQFAIGDVT